MGACAFGGRQRGASLLHPERILAASTLVPVDNPGMPAEPALWYLYLLECRNGSYYAGISNDVDARFQAHLAGKGAKYTRANPPVKVLAMRAYPDRAAASKAEWQLKRQPRERKLAWLALPDPT
jgi:predicted GIY-YIG superfamily endonuclease